MIHTLLHLVFIWYIFSGLGIMYQEKSGNPAVQSKQTPIGLKLAQSGHPGRLGSHYFGNLFGSPVTSTGQRKKTSHLHFIASITYIGTGPLALFN
jgi:hypothetical protein